MSDELVATLPVGLSTDGLLGRRYIARIIDSFVIIMLAMAAVLVLAVLGAAPKVAGTGPLLLLRILVVLLLWVGYGAVLESSRWQATVGKKLLGLRVYNKDGGRLTLMQAVGRSFIKDAPFVLLSVVPAGQALSLLVVGAHIFVVHRSPMCQAIHDRLAGTWVAAPEQTISMHLT